MKVEDLTARIVSASASLIAIIALGTGLYQAKLSRDQAHAAVWPYLLGGNSGNNGYARIVQNVGVGPARIGMFEVRVDGRIMRSWNEVVDSMHLKLSRKGSRTTSFQAGWVVPAGALIDLFELPDTADERLFRSQLGRLDTRVCYCSFYDDCWEQHNYKPPEKVKACVDDPSRRFLE